MAALRRAAISSAFFGVTGIFAPSAVAQTLPPLPVEATLNQLGAANAINSALPTTSAPAAGFALLQSLPALQLTAALNQLAGGIGTDLGTIADQANTPLLNALMQRLGSGGLLTLPGAEGASQSFPPMFAPWVSALSGHSNISGDTVSGAEHVSAGVVGFAAGLETSVGDSAILGGSVAVEHESSSAGAGGKSRSNDITVALYGREAFGQGYAAGAIAYGWHDVITERVVTVSSTDNLQGKFTGEDLSGRIEAGWRFVMRDRAVVAPFVAISGDRFAAPAYGETAVSGTPEFALTYASNTITNGHVEAGLHVARDFGKGDDILSLGADAAWAHQLSGPPVIEAAFAALSGSDFLVRGVQPAKDTALVGVGLQLLGGGGLSYGVRGDGQFGDGITAYSGTLNLVYRF